MNTEVKSFKTLTLAPQLIGLETSKGPFTTTVIGTLRASKKSGRNGRVIVMGPLGHIAELDIDQTSVKEGDELVFTGKGKFKSITSVYKAVRARAKNS